MKTNPSRRSDWLFLALLIPTLVPVLALLEDGWQWIATGALGWACDRVAIRLCGGPR